MSSAAFLWQRQTQTREAVSMETVSYVVGVDVCVVPLQPVIENSDDHSFSCDAFLPDRNHVQVQLWEGGWRPCVLLEDSDKVMQLSICNYLWPLHWSGLLNNVM